MVTLSPTADAARTRLAYGHAFAYGRRCANAIDLWPPFAIANSTMTQERLC
ncbi:hypothetical protein [Moorena bouillonii]|uniref:hypothetical protein n=1 Tax=Moorena bouillonii TaxID=207920 RepID=UPI001301293E|nr:hypothetical protein [Moorena bouillonii]